jgi:hypothetical protein
VKRNAAAGFDEDGKSGVNVGGLEGVFLEGDMVVEDLVI